MTRYAETTSVSSERSRAEIEKTLQRYGANGFMYGTMDAKAVIGFELKRRRIRFDLPMPNPQDKRFTHTEARGTERHPDDAVRAWEQACRQSWRALALAIKAKLEAVESGITSFEEEFLAHIVLPGGQTVGKWIVPQIEQSYQNKKLPPLLPGLS